MGDAVTDLRAVHETAKRAFDLLQAPSAASLNGCSELLREAIDRLRGCFPISSGAGSKAAVREAEGVRAQVRAVSRLLQKARRYHEGWHDILRVQSIGYTEHGAPAPLVFAGRVSFEG